MPLNIGDELKGYYKILKRIGSGGFSVVYLAYDQLYDQNVAIKEFNLPFHIAIEYQQPFEDFKIRFKREALFAGRLRHPHIIEICDAIFEEELYCIIMPYLPETLEQRLQHTGYLELAEAIRIMLQICRGLAHIHSLFAIHCDIKPGNILFDETRQVKITDFGIAHLPPDMPGAPLKTIFPFGAGTIYYMAPEQLEGMRDCPQIDVYAAGALFYRMLTGRHYLDFDTTPTIDAQIRNGQRIQTTLPSLVPLQEKNIPQSLINMIVKALAKPISERYANAGEMVTALEVAWQSSYGIPPQLESLTADQHFDTLLAQVETCLDAGDAGLTAIQTANALLAQVEPSQIQHLRFKTAYARLVTYQINLMHCTRAVQDGALLSSGAEELEQARNLYNTLNLDIDNSRSVVEKIFRLHSTAPYNAELQRLTLNAANDFANLVLLSAPKEGKLLWEAYRWLFPLYMHLAEGLEASLAQSVRENLDKLRQFLVSALASKPPSEEEMREGELHIKTLSENFLEQRFFELKYPQFIEVLRTGEMPTFAKIPRTSLVESSVEPVISPYTLPEKSQSIMRRLLLIVFLIIAISVGYIVISQGLNEIKLPAIAVQDTPTLSTTNTSVTMKLFPTWTSTPSAPTTIRVLDTPTPPPDLQMGAPQFEIQTPAGGRKRVKIAIPLGLTLPAGFPDVAAVLEVQTFTSAGLAPVGGSPDPTFPAALSAPVAQRIPLTAVNLNEIVFELLYVVEPPRVANPGYAMTVTATLLGSDGKPWVETPPESAQFTVSHQPGLVVTQVMTPAIVGIGEPFTYHLTVQNTGETYIEQILLNWDASALSAPFDNSGVWQAYLDTMGPLAPGESREVEIGTRIVQVVPATFEASLALMGVLADGERLLLPQQPLSLTLYAEGITVRPPPTCTNCIWDAAPLYSDPGQYMNTQITRLEFDRVVRIFDVQRLGDEIWYEIETLVDEQIIRGWMWSERVQLNDPTLAEYLRENVP